MDTGSDNIAGFDSGLHADATKAMINRMDQTNQQNLAKLNSILTPSYSMAPKPRKKKNSHIISIKKMLKNYPPELVSEFMPELKDKVMSKFNQLKKNDRENRKIRRLRRELERSRRREKRRKRRLKEKRRRRRRMLRERRERRRRMERHRRFLHHFKPHFSLNLHRERRLEDESNNSSNFDDENFDDLKNDLKGDIGSANSELVPTQGSLFFYIKINL
jgi:hypothetical protein